MSDTKRILFLRLLLAAVGLMSAAIGFLDFEGLIGFASGFGLVMVVLAIFEPALARMRGAMDSVDGADGRTGDGGA